MGEIKFRAVIPERNATIYFDLSDLIHPARKDLFSKRELLIPWLLAGNVPDEYTGLRDKNGKEIYEGDIVNLYHYIDDYREQLVKDNEYSPQVIRWMFSMKIPHWALTDTEIQGMEYVGGFDELEVVGNIRTTRGILE